MGKSEQGLINSYRACVADAGWEARPCCHPFLCTNLPHVSAYTGTHPSLSATVFPCVPVSSWSHSLQSSHLSARSTSLSVSLSHVCWQADHLHLHAEGSGAGVAVVRVIDRDPSKPLPKGRCSCLSSRLSAALILSLLWKWGHICHSGVPLFTFCLLAVCFSVVAVSLHLYLFLEHWPLHSFSLLVSVSIFPGLSLYPSPFFVFFPEDTASSVWAGRSGRLMGIRQLLIHLKIPSSAIRVQLNSNKIFSYLFLFFNLCIHAICKRSGPPKCLFRDTYSWNFKPRTNRNPLPIFWKAFFHWSLSERHTLVQVVEQFLLFEALHTLRARQGQPSLTLSLCEKLLL